MKIRFLNYYRRLSGIIDAGGTDYGHFLGYAGTVLAEKIVNLGMTITREDDFDAVVFGDLDQELFSFACALPTNVKKILVLAESLIYTPFAHHPNILTHDVWDAVLSYNREFCSNKIVHYDIAVTGTQCPLPPIPPLTTVSPKGVFVGSCKNDMRGYGPRRDALVLHLASEGLIDIYGTGWPQAPNYQGKSSNKIESISQYAYSIAIENAKYSGYVTEKIGDSILAERPCLYFGDVVNARRRFDATFVELKELKQTAFIEAKAELDTHYDALYKAVIQEKKKSSHWIDSFIDNMLEILVRVRG